MSSNDQLIDKKKESVMKRESKTNLVIYEYISIFYIYLFIYFICVLLFVSMLYIILF